MVSPCFSSFFFLIFLPLFFLLPFFSRCFRPYMVSPLYFQIQNPPTIRFCLQTPYCTRWNSGMTTKTKIMPMRARRTCLVLEVSIHCTHHVCLTILFCFVLFFLTAKVGFANIFEIKCKCF